MLLDFIKMMRGIAESQPAINQVVDNNVYKLNELKDIEYSVFAYQQRQHIEEDDFWIYSFQLFYVDRLTQDGGNELEVQSLALDILSNIIGTIIEYSGGEIELYNTPVYQPFTQRFKDETVGAYVTVSFRVPKDCICIEEYI